MKYKDIVESIGSPAVRRRMEAAIKTNIPKSEQGKIVNISPKSKTQLFFGIVGSDGKVTEYIYDNEFNSTQLLNTRRQAYK